LVADFADISFFSSERMGECYAAVHTSTHPRHEKCA
jgi:hypothetical protein